jgi:hypothetical protein
MVRVCALPPPIWRTPRRSASSRIVLPTTLEQFELTFAFFADPEGHLVGLSKGATR